MSITVVCLKTGDKYPAVYVNRLYRGVTEGAHWAVPSDRASLMRFGVGEPIDCRFVCITDRTDAAFDEGIEVLPLLEPIYPGWWNKLQMFRAEGAFGQIQGRVLFLDLDVLITGPLDPLVNYPSDFAMHADFQKPWKCASAVMLLEAGSREWIWNAFQENPPGVMRSYHGDQEFMYDLFQRHCRYPAAFNSHYPDIFPQRIVRNYKQYSVDGPPEGASIVALNGHPKPHELKDLWVADFWR